MTNVSPLLLGVFTNRQLAEGAIDELGHKGYSHNEVGILMPGGKIDPTELPIHKRENVAAQGAETGALAGGSFGILAGALAVVAFPGIGLAVTGGIFMILAGATAAGAALGAFAGPFVAMGLSEEEAKHYENEFREGRTIVAVRVRDHEHQDEVVTLLSSHGATAVKTNDGRTLAPMELVGG
jgi:uncharacterized membrane protein